MMKQLLSALMIIICSVTSGAMSEVLDTIYVADSIHSLKEIEVKAIRKDPATVQRLEGAKLQSLSSSSIADALKYFSGVQIKDYGGLGGLKTVNVRSLGAQHVGIYIDGVRITNAQNGTVDLGKYSLSTLESIELFNGGRSRRTQSASEYASGATVYLQTRRPTVDSLSVSAAIASFHTYLGRANFQINRHGWSSFLDAEYVNSQGNYPFRYKSEYEDTVGRRSNSDIEYFRIEGATFKRGFATHLYCYFSERGCPGGIVRRLSDKYTNVGREWDRDLFVQTSWTHRFGNRHELKIIGKYSYEYLRYNTDYPENQNTARYDNHYHQNDGYLSAAYSVTPLRWVVFNAGYDARMTWLTADLKNFTFVRRLDQKAVLAFNGYYRGFQAIISFLYQNFRDHTKIQAGAARPIRKLTEGYTLGYTFRNLNLRAWYKRIFRVPTLNDLYYTQAGNRNLKPEYTRQWNVGADYSYSRGGWLASGQVDAYINRIENRIVCLPLKGTYTWTMMNYGKTFCKGINSTVSGQLSVREMLFSLIGNFTFQEDVNRSNPNDEETYDMPICYSPKFSFGITALISWKSFTLSVSDLHVGKRMWSYADPEDVLSPYNNVDLRATGRWRNFIGSLEINDLFDVQYEHIPRYPMPGRSFKFTLTYTL